jgi:DNA-binding PadR family transcriptional regulator
MPAKHAILGLVLKEPGDARRIAAEARRLLRFADLAHSYPYWALEQLEADGLVGRVSEDGSRVGSRLAGRTIYEATVTGARAFEEWLRSPPSESSLRDDVQFRLAVARPDDVPEMVTLIRDRELACISRQQALALLRPVARTDKPVWHSTLSELAHDAELAFWRGRIDWLQGVRVRLEGIAAAAGLQPRR